MTERKTTAERGYGSRWQKARKTFLLSHPICADHEKRGMVMPATVVDHIVPHKGDMSLFWDHGNWQPLCAACHNLKTAVQDGGGGHGKAMMPGCDVNGVPIDGCHHWNKVG